MKKYSAKDCKKDDMEVAIICVNCCGIVDNEDRFCKHCGYRFEIDKPINRIKDNVNLYQKGYKKGYNDAKKDIIRLLGKEV